MGYCWYPDGAVLADTTTTGLLPGKLHFLAGSKILLRHSETVVHCCTTLYTDTHYTMELSDTLHSYTLISYLSDIFF